jgi:hypothetical protein
VRASERVVTVAIYVVLAVMSALLGVIGAFLVPSRVFGDVEGVSVVLAFVGNAALGMLGGLGTRSLAGAIAPTVGWFVAVGVLTVFGPGGDVVLAGKLPDDPGVVTVGDAFLFVGILSGALAMLATAYFIRRGNKPTSEV